MPRFQRFLGSAAANSSAVLPAAPPPEAVALESDFVVILAALLCAVICVVGLLAVARCAWLRRSLGGGATGSGQPAANKGVKKKVLQSLPKFTYGTAVDGGVTAAPPQLATECAICLVEFAAGDEIRALPPCGHVFHVMCIDTWLGSHSSCPSCRQILMVARCNKCGHFPAPVSESELNVRVDPANHGAPAAGNGTSSSSSSTATAATTTTTNTTCSNNFLP